MKGRGGEGLNECLPLGGGGGGGRVEWEEEIAVVAEVEVVVMVVVKGKEKEVEVEEQQQVENWLMKGPSVWPSRRPCRRLSYARLLINGSRVLCRGSKRGKSVVDHLHTLGARGGSAAEGRPSLGLQRVRGEGGLRGEGVHIRDFFMYIVF